MLTRSQRGGRSHRHTVSWLRHGKFTGMSNFRAFASNQCPNKLPHGRRGFFSRGLLSSLSLFRSCSRLHAFSHRSPSSVLRCFSRRNPSSPRSPLPSAGSLASFPQDLDAPAFHIDDHPPSTAKTSHFARDAQATPDV